MAIGWSTVANRCTELAHGAIATTAMNGVNRSSPGSFRLVENTAKSTKDSKLHENYSPCTLSNISCLSLAIELTTPRAASNIFTPPRKRLLADVRQTLQAANTSVSLQWSTSMWAGDVHPEEMHLPLSTISLTDPNFQLVWMCACSMIGCEPFHPSSVCMDCMWKCLMYIVYAAWY